MNAPTGKCEFLIFYILRSYFKTQRVYISYITTICNCFITKFFLPLHHSINQFFTKQMFVTLLSLAIYIFIWSCGIPTKEKTKSSPQLLIQLLLLLLHLYIIQPFRNKCCHDTITIVLITKKG